MGGLAERFEVEGQVGILGHGRFFGRVLGERAVAGDGEGAAMVGVDGGGAGAEKGVDARGGDEGGAEELGGAG